jgi:hypothetical protein
MSTSEHNINRPEGTEMNTGAHRASGNKREERAGFRAKSEQSARSMSSDDLSPGNMTPEAVCGVRRL